MRIQNYHSSHHLILSNHLQDKKKNLTHILYISWETVWHSNLALTLTI